MKQAEVGLGKRASVTEFTYNYVGDVTMAATNYYEYNDSNNTLEELLHANIQNNYDIPHTKLLSSSVLNLYDYRTGGSMTDTIQHFTYDDFGHITANDCGGTEADMTYTEYVYDKYLFDGGYVSFDADTLLGVHYYIQDYMGNNRMVVNRDGTTEQITHYYPYGGVIGDISTNHSLQAYKFEGKELDRTFGLDWYDIQARQYDAIGVPRWTSVDALAEKYYGISPYSYCGGDPVNRVDKNGQYIEFAEGSSEEFIDKFYQAFNSLINVGAADYIIYAMYNPDFTITISEISNDNKYGSMYYAGTLKWAPEQGLVTNANYILSPVEILQHEFDHAVHDKVKHSEHVLMSKKDEANPYDSKEEQRVIEGSEQNTAKKLGKLKDGETTRQDHGGRLIVTENVNSNEFVRMVGCFSPEIGITK